MQLVFLELPLKLLVLNCYLKQIFLFPQASFPGVNRIKPQRIIWYAFTYLSQLFISQCSFVMSTTTVGGLNPLFFFLCLKTFLGVCFWYELHQYGTGTKFLEKNCTPHFSKRYKFQADKLVLTIFIVSRRFAHLFKWAFSGQCFLTTYNIQLTNNKNQWAVWRTRTKNAKLAITL